MAIRAGRPLISAARALPDGVPTTEATDARVGGPRVISVGALLAHLGVRGGRRGGAAWRRGGERFPGDLTRALAWCGVGWTNGDMVASSDDSWGLRRMIARSGRKRQ